MHVPWWTKCFPDARLSGLFLLALLLRAAFVVYHAATGWQLDYDPGMYLALARSMDHGAYSMFHPLDIPDTVKMPGYPALIWALRHDLVVLLGIQALLSAIKVPLLFALALRSGVRKPWALGVAAWIAIDPMDAMLAGQVLTEALFGTLLLAAVLLLPARTGRGTLLAASLLFAAAAWVRPNGALLVLIAVPAAVPLLRMPWPRAALCLLAAGLLLLPWAMRNQRETGRFMLGDAALVAAAYFQVPHVLLAAGDPRGPTFVQDLMQRSEGVDWQDRQAVRVFHDSLREEVAATFASHPFTWVMVHAQKAANILLAPARGHTRLFFGNGPLYHLVVLLVSVQVLCILLALLVIVWRIRRVPRRIVWLLLIAAYLVWSGALAMTDARFRAPAVPFLLVAVAWVAQGAFHRERDTARGVDIR
jgi:hypothetical protein